MDGYRCKCTSDFTGRNCQGNQNVLTGWLTDFFCYVDILNLQWSNNHFLLQIEAASTANWESMHRVHDTSYKKAKLSKKQSVKEFWLQWICCFSSLSAISTNDLYIRHFAPSFQTRCWESHREESQDSQTRTQDWHRGLSKEF